MGKLMCCPTRKRGVILQMLLGDFNTGYKNMP